MKLFENGLNVRWVLFKISKSALVYKANNVVVKYFVEKLLLYRLLRKSKAGGVFNQVPWGKKLSQRLFSLS